MIGFRHEHLPEKKHVLRGILLSVALLFACLVPFSRFFGFTAEDIFAQNIFFLVSRLLMWLTLVTVYFHSKKAEHLDLIIWPDKRYSFGIHIAFFFVTLITLIIVLGTLVVILKATGAYSESVKGQQMKELLSGIPAFGIFTCITAAVVEECIFRGYMLPRLEFLVKNQVLSIFISTLIFGMLHYGYGTLVNVIGPFLIGAVFAIHYSYFRNLKFLIFFHFFWDALAIFIPHR